MKDANVNLQNNNISSNNNNTNTNLENKLNLVLKNQYDIKLDEMER